MKVAFEPKIGYFLGQIYTTEAPKEDVLKDFQLPKHLQKARKLGDNSLFVIRASNEYNTYKVNDIVHVELDPKSLHPMTLDTTEGLQEFYFMPEDFIIGKKVNIQEEDIKVLTGLDNPDITKHFNEGTKAGSGN